MTSYYICYQVTYAHGDQRMYNIPCPSLPLKMNADILNSRLSTLRQQPCRRDFLEKMELTRGNVLRFLTERGYDDTISTNWEQLFDRIPQSTDETCQLIGDRGILGRLRDLCGGKMRFKNYSQDKPRALPCDYMEKISYNGHALTKDMSRQLEDRMRALDNQMHGKVNIVFLIKS